MLREGENGGGDEKWIWKGINEQDLENPSFRYYFVSFVIVYISLEVYVCSVGRCWQSPEQDVRSFTAGIIGICELPDVGTGIRTLVLMTEQQVFLISEPFLQPLENNI